MDKHQRNRLRDLRWFKRLAKYGISKNDRYGNKDKNNGIIANYFCLRDQGCPSSVAKYTENSYALKKRTTTKQEARQQINDQLDD